MALKGQGMGQGENGLSTVRLNCLDEASAESVCGEHKDYFGAGKSNNVTLEGSVVVIEFFDKRWPLDIAEYAAEQGFASDAEAARVIEAIK